MTTNRGATFTYLVLIGLITCCSTGQSGASATMYFNWSHDRNSFTESPDCWTMEVPSVMLHMKKQQRLLFEFLLPDVSISTYKLHVTCDEEQKTVEISRTKLVHQKYDVCTAAKNPMQLTIRVTKDVAETGGQYKVVGNLTLENEPLVPLYDVFTQYTSLKFGVELSGSKFKRNGNTMYIRNWDSAFRSGKIVPYSGLRVAEWFLYNKIFVILDMPKEDYTDVDGMKFLSMETQHATRLASEFAKSSISIGFIMVFNADSCSEADETNSIPFMTDSYAMLPKFPEAVKVTHCSIDGWLAYSRRGLNDLVKKVAGSKAAEKKKQSKGPACKASQNCTKVLYCAKLEYTSIGGTFPYSRTEWAGEFEKPLKLATKMPPASCHMLQRRRTDKIKVFARAALTYITCPIICDDFTVQYNFYKEMVHLKPKSGQEFTAYGGMEVHASGTMLRVSQSATFLDNGRYSCRAGKINETFDVEVIALPVFHIPGTKFVNNLAKEIYMIEGEKMRIESTVYHSGMSSVERQVTIHLQVKHNGKHFQWASFTQDEFWTNEFKNLASCSTKVRREPTFTTNELWIEMMRGKSHSLSVSYLVVFSAIVTGQDAERFGIPEYEATTETELVVMKRPVESNFSAQMSSCCSNECHGTDCVTEFQINKHLMAIWAENGITVKASFRMGSSQLPDYMKSMVQFNAASGTLKFVTNKGIRQMSKDEQLHFGNLIPVFWFFFPESGRSKSVSKARPDSTGLDCKYDQLCLYTTLKDSALCDKLKFSSYFKLNLTTTSTEALTQASTPPVSVTETSTLCKSIELYMSRLKEKFKKVAGNVRAPTIFLSVTVAVILALYF